MDSIRRELANCIHEMTGEYVIKPSHYEKELCDLLNWKCVDDRYYDAFNGESYIEIKKVRAACGLIWYDTLKYKRK